MYKKIPLTKWQPGEPRYETKWPFNYGLEWEINGQNETAISKTDGLFPLIINNHARDAAEVL